MCKSRQGTDNNSCLTLEHAIPFIQNTYNIQPKSLARGVARTLHCMQLVTGAIFLVPLFFIDLNQIEQMEVDAALLLIGTGLCISDHGV